MFATLLASIGIKDYVYGAVVVALIAGFGWFVHHERTVGAQKVITADATVVAKQVAKNQEIETHAQTTVDQIAKTYADVVDASPAADAPHLRMCEPSSAVPAGSHAGAPSSADGVADVPAAVPPIAEGSSDGFDFGPPLDKSFQTADAQITGLQDYIKACQTAGLCLK